MTAALDILILNPVCYGPKGDRHDHIRIPFEEGLAVPITNYMGACVNDVVKFSYRSMWHGLSTKNICHNVAVVKYTGYILNASMGDDGIYSKWD